LPGERALGSTKEKPVGEARLRVLKSSILLGLLWSDAQSCLFSRVNKVERLDRRRYNPRYIPYVTVMLRRRVPVSHPIVVVDDAQSGADLPSDHQL